MSWLQKLFDTYEKCQPMIKNAAAGDVLLLPICHTTQKAHIEIVLDGHGNFNRAKVLSKDESKTLIPCTETSSGRTGKKPENHPLCDKLQYVAGDFHSFGGIVTSGFAGSPREPYHNFTNSLRGWCTSKYSHPKAKAVLCYVDKGTLVEDLVKSKLLHIGDDNKLLKRWYDKNDKNIPEIFKILPGKENAKSGKLELWQADAFIRWIVEIPGELESKVWKDHTLYQSWIDYYNSIKLSRSLCYVTGEVIPDAEQHPAKLRNDGDKAKLISSNDTSGFTFRGRFTQAEQACTIGFEVTQKAHNALRWLIERQGYVKDGQAIVAWSIGGENIPDPLADTFSTIGADDFSDGADNNIATAQEFAVKFNKKIAGYRSELDDTAQIVVMGMDSATPGRMGITFYRELTGSDFLQRIEDWHNDYSWMHTYRFAVSADNATGKIKNVRQRFVGAPAPKDIAEAAYGNRVDERLRKKTVERILPCILDGQRIPRDLLESAVRRASNRVGLEAWEWEKTLSIACALYKNSNGKEVFEMALDEKRNTRDYLYGRLLALADRLEQSALNKQGENRQTGAARLMQRFSEHPYSTWRTIELSLAPYKAKLGKSSTYIQRMISDVISKFDADDFISDKKLSGEFLLGYHCQREMLWNGFNKSEIEEKE